MALGFIPAWQFSPNPSINPMINQHISMPPGQLQAGVWSSQPNPGSWNGLNGVSGLGKSRRTGTWVDSKGCVITCRIDDWGDRVCYSSCDAKTRAGSLRGSSAPLTCLNCPERFAAGTRSTGLGYVMIDEQGGIRIPRGLEGASSWAFENRKAIILSTIGAGVVAALVFAGKFLR